MPIIEWDEKYSVNIALIDEQHKKIIELLKKLFDAIYTDQVEKVLAVILEEAVAYANYHFKTEEALLAENRFPELEQHQKEHEEFKAKAAHLQKRFEHEKIVIGPETVKLLSGWLDHHILTVDKKYGPFLNARGIF